MSSPSSLERLSVHRTLSAAPPHEIAWVASHGELRKLASGGVLTSKEGPVEGLHVVLDGHLSIHVDRGAGPKKVMEWRGGDVTGVMPFSRIVAPPADVIAEEASQVFTVYRKDLPEMIRECPELTGILVHVMVDRARHFTSSFFHDERLVSLGRLAAGLAHELNNPVSAIRRSANALAESLMAFDAASRNLGGSGITNDRIDALESMRDASLVSGASPILSPLEQEERETSIARWLAAHNAERGLSEALANTDVTLEMLDRFAEVMAGPVLNTALQWLAAGCSTWRLASEIHEASSRISDLVDAIKGFTEMDRAAVPEPVNLEKGLASTLVVLRAKAKTKAIRLNVDIDRNLPPVQGFGGELNQVWANLIDNAIDAAGEGGRVDVSAARRDGEVVVRVVDSGPGVPSDIRDRIFDPFFTTKPVGQGTGLGLDIVRRLVMRHNGRIELDSKPGRTEFSVTLPAAGAR